MTDIQIKKELASLRELAQLVLEKSCRIEAGLGVVRPSNPRKGKMLKSAMDAVSKRNAKLLNK